MALRYDPPAEGLAIFGGKPVTPVACPGCGKAPSLVLTVRPPATMPR